MTRVNPINDLTSENAEPKNLKKNKRIHKSSDKNSQKSVETGSTVIGKRSIRSRIDNESTQIPQMYTESNQDESDQNDRSNASAFTMLPLFGGKQVGKSKFAKIGMATASLLAISTCMLGIFNET